MFVLYNIRCLSLERLSRITRVSATDKFYLTLINCVSL